MRPVKRILFTPLRAWTEKEPTERHTGDTCCTVKTTFVRCRKTNVSVVARRFLPFVPIHARDARRVVTAGRPAGPATVPDGATELPATAPVGVEVDVAATTPGDVPPEPAGPAPVPATAGESPTRGEVVPPEVVAPVTDTCGVVTLGTEALGVVAAGVVTRGADTDPVVTDGTVTDGVLTVGGGGGGVVTDGVVTVVTGGTGTVTLGTVTVGTVGGGSRSASACSVRTPSPTTRTPMAAPFTPLHLRCR